MDTSPDDIATLMDAETWYKANEAVAANMATAIGDDPGDVKAIKIVASRYKNTPSSLCKDLAAGTRNTFFNKRKQAEHWVARTKAKYHINKPH
jgi:hypothetical protein